MARRRLRLHQVWLMVTPGNPLKPRAGMAPFAQRLATAQRIADGRRVVATGIEAAIGTRYTVDTLAALRRRFPRAHFCLILGADNLAQLPRWRRWTVLARSTPIAVLPRPGWTRRALAGKAARRLAPYRTSPGALMARAEAMAAAGSASCGNHAPWCFVPAAEHAASSTAIRAAATSGARTRIEAKEMAALRR